MEQEQILLDRAADERQKIFERYDRGRLADIDPWEDPAFEVYHQTDRYGFIHDKRLPQKIDLNEAKLRSVELERVKKWLKMLNRWSSKETDEKLKRRIYKGIPDKLRSQVWLKILNIEAIMSTKKNVYQRMLQLARQWGTEVRQIDSDVNRQFRDHLFYRERYSIKQKSLFNVLAAYSMYNMEVGYCQGMAGIAGVLLMYMDEEEAFWALSCLLADKKYQMHGLYIEGFPKLNRLVQHHDKILEKCLPKIKHHFDTYNLDSMIYSLKWFFVVFVERVPFSLCLRIWDIYLYDGERVIIAMAYNILKLHQKKLIKLKDMDLLVQYLQSKLHSDFGYDDDTVVKSLEQSMEELRKLKLDLASSPSDIEFAKRPFGEFIEPTTETKIGLRKPQFTETEVKVTENVISRNEKAQQELQENNLEVNQNNAGNIAESEDGCSLLGSSRKSLADTSITSTADLSVFSIGQRSQQFDICVDESRSTYTDAEGEDENSGSAFGSLSITGRTPSAMMITPTPRAITPQDIVRIYVPAAPLEENSNIQMSLHKNFSKNDRVVKVEDFAPNKLENIKSDERNSIISTTGTITPIRQSFICKSNEELTNCEQLKLTSSSRRGSLTKKSPNSFNNYRIPDCEHLKIKRKSVDNFITNREKISSISLSDINRKLMTSFEELARKEKKTDTNSKNSKNNGSDYYKHSSENISIKGHNNYNFQYSYKKLSSSSLSIEVNNGSNAFQHQITHNNSSTHNSDENSDENSSSSPNVKSSLTTPVNEQAPKELSLSYSSQMLINSGQTSPLTPQNEFHTKAVSHHNTTLSKYESSQLTKNTDSTLVLSITSSSSQSPMGSEYNNTNLDVASSNEIIPIRSYINQHSNNEEYVQNNDSNKIRIKVQQKQ